MLTMRASISKDVFPNLIQFNKNIISKDLFDKIYICILLLENEQ